MLPCKVLLLVSSILYHISTPKKHSPTTIIPGQKQSDEACLTVFYSLGATGLRYALPNNISLHNTLETSRLVAHQETSCCLQSSLLSRFVESRQSLECLLFSYERVEKENPARVDRYTYPP